MTSPKRNKPPVEENPKPKKPRRKHCVNCGNLYEVTVPWKKFCSSTCKDDFHNTGGVSFAKYSAVVETRTRRAELAIQKKMEKQIAESEARLLAHMKEAERTFRYRIKAQMDEVKRLLVRLRVPEYVIKELDIEKPETNTGSTRPGGNLD